MTQQGSTAALLVQRFSAKRPTRDPLGRRPGVEPRTIRRSAPRDFQAPGGDVSESGADSDRVGTGSSVAIVIVTRNSLSDLKECLPTVMAQSYQDFTIYVSDNGSTDGTVEWVRRKYPQVVLLENRKNLGFAEGSNVGLRVGLATGAKYLVLLNPDTVLAPRWLQELVRSAQRDPSIAICQSKIYQLDSSSDHLINSAGNRVHFAGIGWCGHLGEPDCGQFVDDRDIGYASGAALLMKSDVAREIGLLDASLFMYHDDLDWSLRARLRGYRVVLSARSIAHHRYRFDKSPAKFFYLERNRLIWLCKTFQIRHLLLIAPVLLVLEGAVLYYAAVNGWLWDKLRSYASFLRAWGDWRASRRRVQATRVLSDRELAAVLETRLELPGFRYARLLRPANAVFERYWKLCLHLLD